MDARAFVADLFGRGDGATLSLGHPLKATRVTLTDADMAAPGWIKRACVLAGGSGSVFITTPAGIPIATIADAAQTLAEDPPLEVGPDDEDDFDLLEGMGPMEFSHHMAAGTYRIVSPAGEEKQVRWHGRRRCFLIEGDPVEYSSGFFANDGWTIAEYLGPDEGVDR